MKVKGAKKVHYDSGPNMTPLVDVVMVILIFLMLTGSFAGAEHYLVSNLPMTASGVGGAPPPPGAPPPDEPLDVRVDSPTRDRYVATAGNIRATDGKTLTAALLAMRQKLNAAGTPTSKIQVVINPGRNVKYTYLIDVYQAALQAEFTKVSFATSH